MPLRYSKHRLNILKSVAALQRRSALDETLFRDFLRRYGKALRQLQRLEDKQHQYLRPVPTLTPQEEDFLTALTGVGTAAYDRLVQGATEAEMWAEKRKRQSADLAGLRSGELTADDVNWFAGGIAKCAKINGSLF